jgi:hypothetical protein
MKILIKICLLSREHAQKERNTMYSTILKQSATLGFYTVTYICTSDHPDDVVIKIIHLRYRVRVQQRYTDIHYTNKNLDDGTAKIIILRIQMRVQQRLYT